MSTFAEIAPPSLVPPGAWVVDPAVSTVGFRVRHFGVATVTGRFRRFDGRLDGDLISGAVEAGSIDTCQPVRDERLRTELFGAEAFPQIRFAARGPLDSPLRGELTIRDVTRPVDFAVDAEAFADGSLRLRATAKISRKAFGLHWAALVEAGRLVVSDGVDLELDLVLRLACARRRPPRRPRAWPSSPASGAGASRSRASAPGPATTAGSSS